MKTKKKIAIIGAGIFGCTLAIILSRNFNVTIFEKKNTILEGASKFNQLRFHNGYHYPRSQITVDEIKKSNKLFIKEYGKNIFGKTKNFYSISKNKSKTSSKKYEKFLKKNKLYFQNYDNIGYFSKKIEKSYIVKEKNLNFFKIKKIILKKIKSSNIKIKLSTEFKIEDYDNFDKIFIATYNENNNVLRNINLIPKQRYKYELVEKIIIKLPKKYKNLSFVVLDGNFVCVDPYVGTDYHLLSDVKLSKLEILNSLHPYFKNKKKKFVNKFLKNKKISLFKKFIDNSSQYLPFLVDAKYIKSIYTIRTINNKSNYNDDRVTILNKINSKVFTILSGKWNTSVAISKNIKKNLYK